MKTILKTVCAYSILIIIIPIFLLKPLSDIFSLNYDIFSDIYNCLTIVSLFFYFVILFSQQLAFDWKHLGKLSWILQSILGFFLILVLSVTLTLLFVGNSVKPSQNQLALEAIQTPVIRQIMPLILVIIAPIMEEIFFRGILIGKLKHKISPWILCFFSIMIFSALHLRSFEEIKAIIPYLSIASVCTIFYVKKNYNLWYPIGIHMVNNLFVEILMHLK